MRLRCNEDECPAFDYWADVDLCQHTSAVLARLKGRPCPHTAQALRQAAEEHRRIADALAAAAEIRAKEEASEP